MKLFAERRSNKNIIMWQSEMADFDEHEHEDIDYCASDEKFLMRPNSRGKDKHGLVTIKEGRTMEVAQEMYQEFV